MPGFPGPDTYGITYNPLVDTPFFQYTPHPSPFPNNDFLLLDGSFFMLLDGTHLLLLGT